MCDTKKIANRNVHLCESASMLADVPGGSEIEGTEGFEGGSEAVAEFVSSPPLISREGFEPCLHAIVRIVSETTLQYLRDAAGRREEGIEIGVDGSLPASFDYYSISFERDIMVSSFRRLD